MNLSTRFPQNRFTQANRFLGLTAVLLAALFLFFAPERPAQAQLQAGPVFAGVSAAPNRNTPAVNRLDLVVSIDESTLIDRLIYNALRRAGYSMTMDAAPMSYAVQMANNGERDGLASQSIGLETRFPGLVVIPEQLASVSFPVFAHVNSSFRIESWNDFAGLRVGHLFNKLHIINQLPKNISASVMRNSFRELMLALENNECDVVVTSSTNNIPLILPDWAKRVGTAETMPSYAYLNSRHKDLAPAIAEGLRAMKADGSYAKIIKGEPLDPGAAKQVLHISSYNPDDTWESSLKEGMASIFAATGNIAYYNAPLYSNRFQTASERAKNAYYTIRTLFSSNPPDIVVASGNNALAFVCAYYGIMFNNVPIVFCDVNTPADELWELGNNAVGVWQSIPAAKTVDQILKMYPRTKNLLVINDYTETGAAWREEMERGLAPYAGRLYIVYNDNVPMRELLEMIAGLPPNTAILMGNHHIDSNGMAFSRAEMQKMIAEKAAVPIFGLMDRPGDGQVGGRYIDPEKQGRLAAEMTLAVLNGARITDIAPRLDTEALNRWIFDASVLEAQGLDPAMLPAGAELINRKLSLAESNPEAFRFFVGLAVCAAATIICLFAFAGYYAPQKPPPPGHAKKPAYR